VAPLLVAPALAVAVAALTSVAIPGSAGAVTCSNGETLTVRPAGPNNISSDPISVRAGDAAEVLRIRATVSGPAAAGETVTFQASGDATFTSSKQNPVGVSADVPSRNPPNTTFTVTLNPGGTVGTQTLVVSTSAGCVLSSQIVQFGPVAKAAITFKPTAVAVDCKTASNAAGSEMTATFTDALGQGVTDLTVSAPADPVSTDSFMGNGSHASPVTSDASNGDGTYQWAVTVGSCQSPGVADTAGDSPSPPGHPTITVTGSCGSPCTGEPGLATAKAVLVEYGPPTTLKLTLSPAVVTADGLQPVTAIAVETDAAGNLVPGDSVKYTASPPQSFNPPVATTDAGGTAKSTFNPPAQVGTVSVGALGQGGTTPGGSATLKINPAPATISLVLNPPNLPPNGVATSTATATVKDSSGEGVVGASVTITRSGVKGAAPVIAHDNGDGTYSATLTALSTPARETITATTENKKTAEALLNETAGPGLSLSLNPSTIFADGKSTSTATAVYTDTNGNPVPNASITFTTSGDDTIIGSPATTDTAGTASATIRASKTVGVQQITAAVANVSAVLPLTQTVPSGSKYWLVASDGGIFAFGGAGFFGSTGATPLNKPIVGMAVTPDGGGYWLVASDGGIFAFGDAGFFGSTGAMKLNKPIVGMAVTPDGGGYWLVASDGGIFAFGDAGFFGSTGAMQLNSPIVGMAAGPGGAGYWLVAADGGIFAFGSGGFFGSTGATKLNSPIVGMAAGPGGGGYWLVASDGGIFGFGSAGFFGSTGAMQLNSPIVGMAATAATDGYWLVAADGGIFNFGNAGFFGSTGGMRLAKPIVGMSGL